MKLITIIYILSVISVVYSEKKSYEGYSLYKITPQTEDDLTVLKNLQDNGVGEFWIEQFYKNYETRIMVPRENKMMFHDIINKSSVVAHEVIDDIQRAIDEQLRPASQNARSSESFLSMNWNQYYSLQEIYDWLDRVQEAYPNVVTIVNMGVSFENRAIKGIRINYRPNQNNTLVGMFQGTLHAREWITTTTLTWIIKEFLTSTDPAVRAFAETFEWHLFPVVNPDGYVYTFTTNRMWRKNRSTRNFTTCVGADNDASNGVDLNRNFDYEWMTAGVSTDPCSNTFPGPAVNSEPETRAISEYILNINTRGRFMFFIDFHSYTQAICIPYSTVSGSDVLTAPNYANMYEVAKRGADALANRNGINYRVGVAAVVLYPMSGTTFDWVKQATNVPFSYLIELRDMGQYGFLLPTDQIIPNNLEIMDALLEMDSTARSIGFYDSVSHSNTILSSFFIICLGLLIALAQ